MENNITVNKLTDDLIKIIRNNNTSEDEIIEFVSYLKSLLKKEIISELSEEIKQELKEKETAQIPTWQDISKPVYQIDKETDEIICEYPSIQRAAKDTGISDSQICYCCKERIGFKTAGGYKWVFVSDYNKN